MGRRGGRSARGTRSTVNAATRLCSLAESVATIRIDGIAAGGDGVGRSEGMACFVPRTAPGDVAQVALRVRARHARGRVLHLLEPSALRVAPTCRHYDADRCGGCQLQHLAADAQRDARLTIVQEALRRIGKRDVPRATLVSGAEWAYRGRLTLTLLPRGGGWVGGLHPHDDSSRVFALEECPVAHPTLVSAWHAVRAQARGLPRAASLRLALRLMPSDNVAVVISGGREWPDAVTWGVELERRAACIAAVWWERDDGEHVGIGGHSDSAVPPTSAFGDDDGPDASEALAFAQVNAEVAEALRLFLLDRIRAFSPKRVVDAYAGVGTLSVLLAQDGVSVVAIESDLAGAQQATRRLSRYPHARVVHDVVESSLPSVLPADVIVLNPPRRGVDIRVTAALADAAARGVRAIVYVSCDPATLARDVGRLAAWRIEALRCFDMFPQTAHVETVCVLVPEPA